MNRRPDREDAVARALDILPPGDPAASDPRLVRDEALAEEARATREAAADLWLAVSPLRAAPPEVLHSVMDKIGLPAAEAPVPRVRRLAPLLAASGWAAAIAVTVCLWPRHGGEGTRIADSGPKDTSAKASNRDLGADASADGSPAELNASTARLRRDYANLQKVVEMMRRSELATLPRVLSLSTPGSPRRTPEESRQQMFQKMYQIVANSFRDQMEVHNSPAGDAEADFVIERGYMQPGMDLADDNIVLRHRNFPEQAWQERGFWRSGAGEYYDPLRHLLWTPDPLTNSFLGRRAAEGSVDLAGFQQPEQGPGNVKVDLAKNEPEGFLLDDPVTKKAEVVIDGVKPPKEGHEQRIEWTDASGASGTIPVVLASSTATANPNGSGAMIFLNGGYQYLTVPGGPFMWNSALGIGQGNFSGLDVVSSGGVATVMASFSTTSAVTSFQLVEVPIGGLQTGAGRIIVSGGN